MFSHLIKEKALLLLVLAGLAIIAYLPTLTQPFIEDDFPNIRLALEYGPVSGWEKMASDSVHRVRATTFILLNAIYRVFGPRPEAFYSAGIFLHIVNCWLLFAAGRWRAIGYKASFWAAAFFAVYEGHQEAVMWISGGSELLLFFFGFLSFLFWLIFLEKGTSRLRWLALSLVFFLLALLSKESSGIFILLFALPTLFPQFRPRQALYLLPHISVGAIFAISIFMTRSHSFRFNDQSFVLSAPFWVTWTKSYGALLWFWGLTAIIGLILWKEPWRLLLISCIWMGICFSPYMFVDYMHRIPSRQTYLASAGLAWVMGAAIVVMIERYRKNHTGIVTAVLLMILIHNVAYLWTKKRQQFLIRAQPTTELLSFARGVDGSIFVKCFPLAPIHAEAAFELILNRPASDLIWEEEAARKQPQAATFCYEKAQ